MSFDSSTYTYIYRLTKMAFAFSHVLQFHVLNIADPFRSFFLKDVDFLCTIIIFSKKKSFQPTLVCSSTALNKMYYLKNMNNKSELFQIRNAKTLFSKKNLSTTLTQLWLIFTIECRLSWLKDKFIKFLKKFFFVRCQLCMLLPI